MCPLLAIFEAVFTVPYFYGFSASNFTLQYREYMRYATTTRRQRVSIPPTTTPTVKPTLEVSNDCVTDGKQTELLNVVPLMTQTHERAISSAVVFSGQVM